MATCRHLRGEFSDDYQHCLDCGREVVLISGVWFEVEAWVRLSTKFLEESVAAPPTQEKR